VPTALFLLVTADSIERLDDELGYQRGLLVGREVARAGKGDHAYPGTHLKCAAFIVGDPAVAAFAMTTQAGTSASQSRDATDPCRSRYWK
jgi:hypothetical protein